LITHTKYNRAIKNIDDPKDFYRRYTKLLSVIPNSFIDDKQNFYRRYQTLLSTIVGLSITDIQP
jgi:hypothetical protein